MFHVLGKTLCTARNNSIEDVNRAVDSTQEAFNKGWRQTSGSERSKILLKAAQLIRVGPCSLDREFQGNSSQVSLCMQVTNYVLCFYVSNTRYKYMYFLSANIICRGLQKEGTSWIKTHLILQSMAYMPMNIESS